MPTQQRARPEQPAQQDLVQIPRALLEQHAQETAHALLEDLYAAADAQLETNHKLSLWLLVSSLFNAATIAALLLGLLHA